MTIQIDDQGWGTPVGGVGIIVVRKETEEIHYDIVPIELFDLENFRNITPNHFPDKYFSHSPLLHALSS